MQVKLTGTAAGNTVGGGYFVQDADESFRVGDRVRVLSGQGTTRVSR
jgi:hypothetical protein